MRIRFLQIAICVCCFCFVCCGQSKNNKQETSLFTKVIIEHKNVDEQTAELIDLIDSVFILPLQRGDNILLGRVSDVRFENDKVYVSDDSSSQTLTVYDLDGNPLFRVGRQGRGPAEYLGIGDFFVNSEYIILFDDQAGRMLVYDVYGVFQHYFETDAYSVGLVNDTTIVEHNGAGVFTFKNLNGEVLHSASLDFRGIEAIDWNSFSYQAENLNFLDIINQRVYRITLDSLMPYRQVDLGKWQVPAGYFSAFQGSAPTNMFMNVYEQTLIYSNNDYGLLLRYRENSEWESYSFQVKFMPRIAFRHKASGRTLLSGSSFFGENYDPVFESLNILSSATTTCDDFFVTSISSERALEFAGKDRIENPMLFRLQQRVRNMEICEDDNPLLLFYRLKDPACATVR